MKDRSAFEKLASSLRYKLLHTHPNPVQLICLRLAHPRFKFPLQLRDIAISEEIKRLEAIKIMLLSQFACVAMQFASHAHLAATSH